jgi:hypothetical protein
MRACPIARVALPERTGLARRLMAVVLSCLLPLPAGAQAHRSAEPIQIRITGANSYEMPGVIKIERDQITGRPRTTTDRFVRFSASDGGRRLAVPEPGSRSTGLAQAIADGLIAIVPDHERETLYVPLDAIAKIEVGRVPRSRAAWTTTGVVAGIGAFVLVSGAFLHMCGDEGGCGGGGALFTLGVGGGIAAAAAVASIGRTRWRVVSVGELNQALPGEP